MVASGNMPNSDVSKIQKATVANMVGQREGAITGSQTAVYKRFLTGVGTGILNLYEHDQEVSFAINLTGEEWKRFSPESVTPDMAEYLIKVTLQDLRVNRPQAMQGFMTMVLESPILGQNIELLRDMAQAFGLTDDRFIFQVAKTLRQLMQQQQEQQAQNAKAKQAGKSGVPSVTG